MHLAALILWRATHDHDVLVDEVVLDTLPRYYNPASALELLHGGPVPAAADRAMNRLSPELLHQTAVILSSHTLVDAARPHRGGPSATVGYRIRELRSTPGWIESDWKEDLKLARGYREKAWQRRADGRWKVTQDDLRAAAQAAPDTPAYDYPALPTRPDGYRLWPQDAHHLLAVGTTLTTVADTLPAPPTATSAPWQWSSPVTPAPAANYARAPRTSSGSGPPSPPSPPTSATGTWPTSPPHCGNRPRTRRPSSTSSAPGWKSWPPDTLRQGAFHDGLEYAPDEVADVAGLIEEAVQVLYVQPAERQRMAAARLARRKALARCISYPLTLRLAKADPPQARPSSTFPPLWRYGTKGNQDGGRTTPAGAAVPSAARSP